MSVRITLLLPALAALALGLSATPAVAATCRPGPHQRTIARSPQAVLLGRPAPQWGFRLWGCSRQTGVRRLIAGFGANHELVTTPLLRGTHVVYVDDVVGSGGVGVDGAPGDEANIISDDAVHRDRHASVASVSSDGHVDLRMDGDGALAWRDTLPAGQRLLLWRPGDTVRLVDEGFSLTAIGFTGRTLTWRHDGVDQSAPSVTRTLCPTGAGLDSTMSVDVIHTNPGAIACWRATGASVTFPATTTNLASAGSWVVAVTDDSIDVRVICQLA